MTPTDSFLGNVSKYIAVIPSYMGFFFKEIILDEFNSFFQFSYTAAVTYSFLYKSVENHLMINVFFTSICIFTTCRDWWLFTVLIQLAFDISDMFT